MRRALIVAITLVLVLAGCRHGSGGSSSAGTALVSRAPAPRLAGAAGWRIRRATTGGISTAEASTARLRDAPGVFPGDTLRRLPPGGSVIFVDAFRTPSTLPKAAARPLPYRLPDFRDDRGWEGQPAVNVPRYVLFTSRDGHMVDVRVFFGTQAPSERLRARAQAELDTLTFG